MDMMRSGAAHRVLGRRRLPREVMILLPREREIASVVYMLGATTAKEVERQLSAPLTNSAVRSMLNRLVAKGVLKRALSYKTFVYLPGLTPTDSGSMALRRFVEDYFAGSIEQAAETMRELLDARG